MDERLVLLFIFIAILVIPAFAKQLKEKVYNGKGFSIIYPSSWESSEEEGIVNLFPTDNFAGITIVAHQQVQLSQDEIRALLLEMNGIINNAPVIITNTKNDVTEYYFEYTSRNIKWQVKAFHQQETLYLVSTNCHADRWEHMKPLMLKSLQSFRIK
ncbi:PsbP protein [Filimonas lacunae]|uniref:PsbP protein n=1 Tax=Filimonas lacunae TaxID=477680 RepID=A0A173MJP8_9BACT|nr:hypothetical protein [Filimonas lacunae]BAV07618.1 hypothetical protein FLA_3644 [Filimonas lacunae]SIT29771.1 PsbP protein [Filimonas lacunae]